MKKNHYKNYVKYKNEYLVLRETSLDDLNDLNDLNNSNNLGKLNNNENDLSYEFKFFGNVDEQVTFIKKHFDNILELNNICFPSNEQNQDKMEKFSNAKKNIINSYSSIGQWYFALHNEIIVGYCLATSREFIEYDGILETYKKIKLNKEKYDELTSNIKTVSFYISSLCKNKEYKHVGGFLLKQIGLIGINNLKIFDKYVGNIIYLSPESSLYKNGYEYYINEKSCVIDDEYYKSNMKLIDFYKHNDFKISKTLYEMDKCDEESNEYIIFNVMYKKITI